MVSESGSPMGTMGTTMLSPSALMMGGVSSGTSSTFSHDAKTNRKRNGSRNKCAVFIPIDRVL